MMKSILSILLLFALFLPQQLSAQEPHAIPDELLIQLLPSVEIDQVLSDFPEIIRSRMLSERMGMYWLKSADQASTHRILIDLQRHPMVLQAQWNHVVEVRHTEATIPADPQFANQWGMNNTGQTGGLSDADIDAPEAWDLTTGQVTPFGDSLVVAVIDDGFDLQQEDIRFFVHNNEIAGNGIDDDGNGYIDDVNGWNSNSQSGVITTLSHGTHVSGIAAASGDNGIGVTGVAWGARVLPIQTQNSEAAVVAAYNYVLEQRILYDQSGGTVGAYVVGTNASFGVNFGNPVNYPLWCGIYDSLGAHGILSAVATMNIGQNVDVVNDVPSACSSPYLISVTNTTDNDVRSNGAAYGLTTIDLGAPGSSVISTLPNNSYGYQTGTSMSCPHVAGAILIMHGGASPALYAQYLGDPAGTALLMKSFIMDGVDSLPTLTGTTVSGGRLNLFGALAEMQSYSDTLSETCLPAYSLKSGQITDSSALISWKGGDSATSYVFRYRKLSDSTWTDSISTDSSFISLMNLGRCESYVYQIKVICTSDTIDYLATGQFKTEGCCEPPANQIAIVQNDSTILFSWNAVFGASGYEYRVRESGGSIVASGTVPDTFLLLSQLQPCTFYEWQLATICDTINPVFDEWQTVRTLGCGTCIDAAYCISRSTDTEFEWIDEVRIGANVNVSGQGSGYDFFESPSMQLQRDTFTAIALIPDFQQFTFNEWWRIWIDFNQDGVFTDSTEMVFDSQGGVTGSIFDSLFVPASASPGATRMRVTMKYPGFSGGSSPSACETFEGGEVEDYCVFITDEPQAACDKVSIIDVSYTPLITQLSISATPVPGADSYEVGVIGAGYPTGFTLNTTSATASFLLPMADCEIYEITMRAICNGIAGEMDSRTLVTAGCGNCSDLTYCDAAGLSADSAWLEAFQLNSLLLKTGPDNGYIFLANQSIDLTVFDNLTGWILPAADGLDSVWIEMWIDQDADGVMIASERIFGGKYAAGDTATFAWLVPQNISLDGGRIRMMVSKDPIQNSCFGPQQGEVEDLCFTGKSVGIDPELSIQVNVFPNPFNDEILIQSDLAIESVDLRDIHGRTLGTQASKQLTDWQISTELLPSGIYFVEVQTNAGMVRKKVVKRE